MNGLVIHKGYMGVGGSSLSNNIPSEIDPSLEADYEQMGAGANVGSNHSMESVNIDLSSSIKTSAPPTSAPQNLIVRLKPDSLYEVELTWDPVPGATEYKVFRQYNSTFISVSQDMYVGSTSTNTFDDVPIDNGHNYYGVIASNADGDSPLSNVVSIEAVNIPLFRAPTEKYDFSQTSWTFSILCKEDLELHNIELLYRDHRIPTTTAPYVVYANSKTKLENGWINYSFPAVVLTVSGPLSYKVITFILALAPVPSWTAFLWYKMLDMCTSEGWDVDILGTKYDKFTLMLQSVIILAVFAFSFLLAWLIPRAIPSWLTLVLWGITILLWFLDVFIGSGLVNNIRYLALMFVGSLTVLFSTWLVFSKVAMALGERIYPSEAKLLHIVKTFVYLGLFALTLLIFINKVLEWIL
ncbi:MAG: hypothetical protein Q6365_002175 [Candidatus Sigynarchaeota archaeon]